MSDDTCLLLDYSSIARPMWEACKTSEERSSLAAQIVARVHALALQHPHAAVCMDSGKSFRHDLDASYKAHRVEAEAAMHHQFNVAADTLKADGFPVWAVKGFEADDLIATATREALACDGDVLIVSSDKDLCALIGPKVRMKKTTDGSIVDETVLFAKLGVKPEQVSDYLSLVGDASDGVKGAKGIGGVNAAKLLATFGTLDALYVALDKGEAVLTDGIRNSLIEFRDRLPLVRQLITLRSDVPLPFHEIAVEREAKPISDLPPMFDEPFEDDANAPQRPGKAPAPVAPPKVQEKLNVAFAREETPVASSATPPAPAVAGPSVPNGGDSATSAPSQALVPIVEFERQLEPRTMQQASWLAEQMHLSRLFGAYGSPQGVLATVLAGRELGMSAMASLRAMHIIENKPCLSADAMRALVLKSGLAEYFRCKERTDTKATFETKRRGDPEPQSLTFTIDEAKQSGVVKPGSGWIKYPSDMLSARASAKLSRLVYPDVISGLYDPSEIG